MGVIPFRREVDVIIDILALLEIVKLGAEFVGAVSETINAIQDAIDLLSIAEEPSYTDIDYPDKVELLKLCTKIVVNLALDLNCFPMGYATTLLFDTDGNPI